MTDEEFAKSIGANISDDDFAKSIGAVSLGKPSFGEQTMVALKQGYNVAGDLINRAATGVAGSIADVLGQDDARDKMYQAMEKDLEESRQWANPNKIQPGVLPSIIGAIPNLPAQIATFPLAPFETGQEMIQRGESLSDALKGTAITTGMNALGIALPATIPGSLATRTVAGATINTMQTVAQQLSLQRISKTKEGKEAYKLKPQDIAIAGVMGAGFGAVARPPKPKAPPVVDPALDTKVDEFFKDVPYTKSANEIAADDATVARLEAAIAKQNPQQGEIRVGKDQEAYFTSPETEFARQQAEQRMLQENEGAYADPFNRMSRELAPDAEPRPPVNAVDPFEQIRQQALASGDQQRYQQAQAALEARQAALEQEVAQRTSLDFNAAERARREAASTGLEPWREQQQMAAEQRMPGDNTPLDFTKETSPYGLTDTPYQYKGGLDFNAAEFQSLPIEKQIQVKEAWKRRNIERQAEQDAVAKQEQRLQEMEDTLLPMEEALREGAYKPTGDGQGPKTRAAKAEAAPGVRQMRKGPGGAGQGGSTVIFGDLAEGIVRLGGMLKGKKTGQVVLPPDSLAEPRSPEMVKTKLEKSAKAKAIGLKGTVYDSPGSLEELRANPGKDIGFSKVGVGGLAYEFDTPKSPGQFLGSGAEAVVRRNTANNSTKYVRGLYSKARNLSENLVHKYVTGPGALTSALRGMDAQEKLTAYQLVQKLSKERQNYTPELADHLGLSTAVRNYMDVRQAAFKGQFDFSASVNAKLGFKQFEELGGYSPTNFDSAYRTLVYEVVKDKNGVEKQKIVAVVNANSAWQRKAGVDLYKERAATGKLNYKFVDLETRGLKKDTSPNKQFDAMATMLAKMAELDPRFAEAKAEIDSLIAEKTKKLYSFNVHEMHKKGVEGGIGNKPWLSLERNADDFFKMEIDHLDTGFRYWSYQDAITKTRQFVTDPSIEHPNAKRWAEQYTERIAGQKLNPLGGLLNWTIDLIQTPMGLRGSKNAYIALGAARAVGNAWLMGIWNPMFMVVQSSQLIVNGLTEAARMRVDLDIPHHKMAAALPNAVAAWSYLTMMDKTGKWDKAGMFGDLKDDYKWAQEHGLSTYSEVALSHEAAMDPKVRLAKDIAMHPTTLPEFFTRPTTFLWYTQMFREAGYTGEQARIAARDATDYAMTNYHADELPMMYKDLGVSGKNIGSLRAFVHNNTDQFIARAMEAQKYPAAFSTMMGMTLLLQGITGVVGYSLANELSMVFTDKTLTEWMEELLEPENKKYLHGFVSAWSDADIQSRFSTADVLPGSFAEGIVGPQISKFGKVLVAGYEYGKNQDQASLLKFGKELTPSGMAGIFEDKLLTDEQGYVLKDGKRKYDKPRTQGERDFRRQYNTRPLRERLEDEALYRDNQRMAKMNEKQRNAFDRMTTAHILGDTAGFAAARKKYIEEGGSMSAMEAMLERAKAEAKLSERKRKQGELTDSLSSIQRFKNYQEKP